MDSERLKGKNILITGAARGMGAANAEHFAEQGANVCLGDLNLEEAQAVADRINAAAEMGDLMQIKAIAEELMSDSDAVAPFCDRIVRLADDFDFDGIQNLLLEFDS